jgi:hypothetical protein
MPGPVDRSPVSDEIARHELPDPAEGHAELVHAQDAAVQT